MCLILIAYRQHADTPLIVAANRDEFYARPALTAHHWNDTPGVLGGRDQEALGTWLAVSRSGRFAAVTNYAGPLAVEPPARSRGDLPTGFLIGDQAAVEYSESVDGDEYAGFNLLAFDGDTLAYRSNRGHGTEVLAPGYYALANADLDCDWPKVHRGKQMLRALVETANGSGVASGDLLDILTDDRQPDDTELPQRGNDIVMERRIAPCFIRGEEYGTRACTALSLGRERITLAERTYGPNGVRGSESVLTTRSAQGDISGRDLRARSLSPAAPGLDRRTDRRFHRSDR